RPGAGAADRRLSRHGHGAADILSGTRRRPAGRWPDDDLDQGPRIADCRHYAHGKPVHHAVSRFARHARARAAQAAVLHRCGQCAAGHALVGAVAGRGALARARPAATGGLRRLAARDRDAVPRAGALHVRLPADRVPALDGAGRTHALALRPGGPGAVRRPVADPRRRTGPGAPVALGRVVHAGRLGHRAVLPSAHAVARRRQDLARGVVRGGTVPRVRGAAGVRGFPARRRRAADVRRDQDRHLRPAAAGVLHGGAPDVPVLRRQRGARLPAVAADVAAGRVLAAGAGAPGAGTRARLPVAVDRERAAAGTGRPVAVALL